jgi:hypothetical protein
MSTDSTEARKKRIIMVLLMVPTLIFLMLALHGIATDYQHIRHARSRLAARTAVAEGEIVAQHDAWHASVRVPKDTVTFSTDSGQPIQFVMLANNTDKIGMKIPIHYDPQEPNNYSVGDVIFSFSDLVFDNAFFLLMGLYFLFMVFRVRRSSID